MLKVEPIQFLNVGCCYIVLTITELSADLWLSKYHSIFSKVMVHSQYLSFKGGLFSCKLRNRMLLQSSHRTVVSEGGQSNQGTNKGDKQKNNYLNEKLNFRLLHSSCNILFYFSCSNILKPLLFCSAAIVAVIDTELSVDLPLNKYHIFFSKLGSTARN